MKPALLCVLVLLALIVASECQPRPAGAPGGRRPGNPARGPTCQRACQPGGPANQCGPGCVCRPQSGGPRRPGSPGPLANAYRCVSKFAEKMVQ
uniref:Putative secreted protein n=1 Tax=Amblyomma cajennense TaxID=34607 RepID=A0A023FBV0_AMBCJ